MWREPRLFSVVPSDRARGSKHKLKHQSLHLNKETLLWGQLSSGTGCPESLCSLHPSRYSKAVWTWSWASSLRWPCLSQRGWSRWPPEASSSLSHAVLRYWKYWTGRVWVWRQELEVGEWRLSLFKCCKNAKCGC